MGSVPPFEFIALAFFVSNTILVHTATGMWCARLQSIYIYVYTKLLEYNMQLCMNVYSYHEYVTWVAALPI